MRAALAAMLVVGCAPSLPPATHADVPFVGPVERYELANGLRVILAPNAESAVLVDLHVRDARPLPADAKHEAAIDATGGWSTTRSTADGASSLDDVPPESLETALALEAERLFGNKLSPRDATLVLVGRFDAAAAHGLVARRFAWIPPGRPSVRPAGAELAEPALVVAVQVIRARLHGDDIDVRIDPGRRVIVHGTSDANVGATMHALATTPPPAGEVAAAVATARATLARTLEIRAVRAEALATGHEPWTQHAELAKVTAADVARVLATLQPSEAP